MVKRKRLAIYFNSDYKQATGLVLYLLNIIRALCSIEDNKKPQLIIIYLENSPIEDVKSIGYEYVEYYMLKRKPANYQLLRKIINKASRLIMNLNVIKTHQLMHPFPRNIDLIYPYYDDLWEAKYVREKVYWKADFQERYYPQFFPKSDLDWSNKFLDDLSEKNDVLVLSSHDALKSYSEFYPCFKNEIKLLRFASYLPEFQSVNSSVLMQKFQIERDYFVIANQFWPHKNHMVVLEAINLIKEKINCLFIFTGQTSSYRDSNYFPSLKEYVQLNNLDKHVRFLGFIDRREQLKLMDGALAIIQPSLFEGWSTVIEDAKALGKLVLASDLAVNKEQISQNVLFFNPHSPWVLGDHILKCISNEAPRQPNEYSSNINVFKDDIRKIFNLG